MITKVYSLTNTEVKVLKVMAEENREWTWMILDRTLATRSISRFGNVAKIVISLMNTGMVEPDYNDNLSRARYRP